jgi:hypothetical protein
MVFEQEGVSFFKFDNYNEKNKNKNNNNYNRSKG